MSSLLGLSMAQEEEDDYSLEGKFSAAVKVVQSLPVEGSFQPSDDMMLMFYSYYKQATAGPCNFPRPIGFWDSNSKAKWDAWSSLGNMTKEEAMKNYIEAIQLILETVPISDEVSQLVQKLGNFYTEVDGDDVEENAVDSRPFTRPFADHQGFGDLWDDIQNIQEEGTDSPVPSVSSEEAEGSKESSHVEQDSDWRIEDDGDEDFSMSKEEEIIDWNPDARLLTVDNRGWRSGAKGSGSSVAPSMSSFTNGTHSSLNSEVEEEELICSIEPCAHYDPYMQFNGCLSSHMGVASDRNHRSTDSDNEEFCDSMEHLAMEERLPSSRGQSPGSGAATVRPNDLWFESNTTLKGADDEVLIVFTPSKHSNSLSRRENTSLSPKPLCKSRDAACGCELHPVRASRENVNEQIAVALLRLQRDMASALHRLHTLEELARSQVKEQTSRSPSPRLKDFQLVTRNILFLRPSWWPFDVCPLTAVLTVFWPLVSHWLVKLYLQRRRRKIP
ncbi:acyl-CoA-binding domain-containing protein 5 isoform X1 [Oryzias melastigma]|uniref:acyl-CoA-binding domain-containing protein 5 isoform X1 n=1 Tax=Oryzias melastigma TaxID=30732 RepID=UPI000CF813E8|nr:acyl-CoA-binding domain-containing protein 5 isoform X1 [Oryzias melastigma]XP_036072247.1 acyl-CoA-binding domain-containing protein 5 isoform X1 [Oryzias melastigma]